MKNYFFDENLIFEVHVIGYEKLGESIVLFLKADDKIVFSGMIDCYEQGSINKSVEVLKEANCIRLDFVCLTHPHKDHVKGFQFVLDNYCDKDTVFRIPPFHAVEKSKYSFETQDLYGNIFETIIDRSNINRKRIKFVTDRSILYQSKCISNCNFEEYIFEIISFAPDSEMIA
jgi:ribonuclease BN (tRNA processing enzyme)